MPDVDMLGVTTYDVHMLGAVKLSFSVGATLSFRLSLATVNEKKVTY